MLLVMMMTRMVDAGVRHVSDRYPLVARDHHIVDGQDRLRVDSDPRHLRKNIGLNQSSTTKDLLFSPLPPNG